MSDSRPVHPAEPPTAKRLNVFERYLSLWVALGMGVGIFAGKMFPAAVDALRGMEFGNDSQINIPIAVLIWLMIYPMMLKVDFTSILGVRKRPKGLIVTLVVNWLVKPFSMALFGYIFFKHMFLPWIGPELADQYLAGTIILAAAPGTAWNSKKTGKGQYIDISLFDCGLTMLENAVPKYSWTGEVAHALGSRHPSAAPHNVYKTKDGFIVIITIENKAYARLCKAMGMPELIEDPRFKEVSGRLKNVDELDGIVNSWTGKLPTAKVVDALKAANLAYGVVRNVKENIEDEHSKVRNMMPTVVQPKAGPVTIPGCPIHYSETEIAPLRPAPLLGEHTEEIVTKILKYPKEKYAELQKKGVF